MFSLFSRKSSEPEATEPKQPEQPEAPPQQPAVRENPLASMSVEAPDVPPASSHGFDIGALTAPPAQPPATSQIAEVDPARTAELTPKVVEVISTVYDPEIPVNIYELGLIYKIEADAESRVRVEMTLTSPACPSAQQLPSEVRFKVKAIEGVTDAFVDVVWEPAWTKDLMSEEAKLALGMF